MPIENEVKFAGTIVEVNNEVVAKVKVFNKNTAVSEEDITGSEDYIPGTDVLYSQFTSIAVSETASIEGIAIQTRTTGLDDGQSELKDYATTGQPVALRQIRNNGHGYLLNGFFTSYEENGDVSGVYKYKGTYRVISKQEIVPGS